MITEEEYCIDIASWSDEVVCFFTTKWDDVKVHSGEIWPGRALFETHRLVLFLFRIQPSSTVLLCSAKVLRGTFKGKFVPGMCDVPRVATGGSLMCVTFRLGLGETSGGMCIDTGGASMSESFGLGLVGAASMYDVL